MNAGPLTIGSGRQLSIDDYIIQQTSCPAVKVTFPAGDTVEGETSMTEISEVWKRAYTVFCAVTRFLGMEESETFSIAGDVYIESEPSSGVWVLVDGTLEVLTDQEGRFRLKLLESGYHTAEAYSGARRSAHVGFDETTQAIRLQLK